VRAVRRSGMHEATYALKHVAASLR
jgi:hypothetical protein